MHKLLTLACLPSFVFGLVGCGQARSTSSNPDGGSLGLGLQVSPGASLTLASYAISGPNGYASAGTVLVGDSPDVPVVLSHLPVGQGYELDVSGTASDGVTVCDGSTTFDVSDSSASLELVVHLTCAVPSGDLEIQVILNLCPVLDGLSARPTSLKLGGISSLDVVAHDSDGGPAALAYSWALNGVKLPRQTGPTLSFACSSVGNVMISATVSDGDPNPSCADSDALMVSCE